jgi:putative hemolysin
MDKPAFRVDIDALFRKKNPGLYRWIPGFLLRWVKRTVHQEEINGALERNKNYRDAEFAEHIILDELGARINSSGIHNIPSSGGAIIAANHPLGGLDGMILMVEASKVRKDVRVIVNDILTALPNFGDIFIPVNKIGSKAKESLQRVEDAYASNKLVLVFPAGLCSRQINGAIRDLDWQKSFISRALKYNLPIVPTYISGENSNWFYSLANFRKFLGIKANIEMFYLPDEMFRQKGKEVHMTVGKPIPASTFDQRHSQAEWAQMVKDFVYQLRQNPDSDFTEFILSGYG